MCSTIIFPHSTTQIIVFGRRRCRCRRPCKRTRVLENISEILTVSSPFKLFHYVLNKIFYNGKAFIGYQCFGAFWSAKNLP